MTASLGDRIREARLAKGLSQTQLAQGIVSPSYVSLIESDKRVPELDVLESLAERLSTSVEYLRTGIDAATRREERLSLRYAELALANGQHEEAAAQFRRLSQSHNANTRFSANWGLARALEAQGYIEQAIAQLHGLLGQTDGDTPAEPGVFTLWTTLCRLYREVGDTNQSIAIGEKALQEAHVLGLGGTDIEIELAVTLIGSYYERGDYTHADMLSTSVLERAEQHGSARTRASAYWNASLVAEARGELPRALELAERALALLAEGDDERGISRLRVAYAWLLLRRQDPDPEHTLDLLLKSYDVLRERGSATDVAYCETEMARCSVLLGDVDAAVEYAKRSIDRLGPFDTVEKHRARLALGQALFAAGRHVEGLTEAEHAAEQLTVLKATRQAAEAWRETAEMAARLGMTDQALHLYRRLADCVGAHALPVVTHERSSGVATS